MGDSFITAKKAKDLGTDADGAKEARRLSKFSTW